MGAMSAPYCVPVICTGNICRSPMGEIVLPPMRDDADLGAQVDAPSSGLAGWHSGDGADRRPLRLLRVRGDVGSEKRARQFTPGWFAQLDLVLAADQGHLKALRAMAHDPADRDKIHLMREFDPEAVAADTLDIDDPYYGCLLYTSRCV